MGIYHKTMLIGVFFSPLDWWGEIALELPVVAFEIRGSTIRTNRYMGKSTLKIDR